MEKLEKFEFVFRYAQRLRLKPQEMGEYFLSKAKEPSFVPNPLVNVGQFCYDDKTFSTDLIEQKTVSGIVSYVERKRALIVGLRSIELPWSSDFLQVCETRNLTDGKEATRLILEKPLKKILRLKLRNGVSILTKTVCKKEKLFWLLCKNCVKSAMEL